MRIVNTRVHAYYQLSVDAYYQHTCYCELSVQVYMRIISTRVNAYYQYTCTCVLSVHV